MKSFVFRLICFLVFLLLFLELFYRFVIPASHPPYRRDLPAYPIHSLDPDTPHGIHTFARLAHHRVPWNINSHGFNSEREYIEGIGDKTTLIGVFGDSYIEGLNVRWSENIASQLDSRLPAEIEVYSFGLGGTPISNIQNVLTYARALFAPDIAIIKVGNGSLSHSLANVGRKDLCRQYYYEADSLRVLQSCPYRVSHKRMLRKSATLRYLTVNANLDLGLPKHNTKLEAFEISPELGARIVDRVVADLVHEHPGIRYIFLCDADHEALYGLNAEHATSEVFNQLNAIRGKYGIEVLDLGPVFYDDYVRNGERIDFKGDSHWNARAHRLAAEALTRYLQTSSLGGQAIEESETALARTQ